MKLISIIFGGKGNTVHTCKTVQMKPFNVFFNDSRIFLNILIGQNGNMWSNLFC